jgi:hypothetical protein
VQSSEELEPPESIPDGAFTVRELLVSVGFLELHARSPLLFTRLVEKGPVWQGSASSENGSGSGSSEGAEIVLENVWQNGSFCFYGMDGRG